MNDVSRTNVSTVRTGSVNGAVQSAETGPAGAAKPVSSAGNLSAGTQATLPERRALGASYAPALGQPPQLYPVDAGLAAQALGDDGPPTDWSVVLQRFTQAVRQNGMQGALSELKLLKTDIQQSSDARMKKILEWASKMEEVAAQNKTTSIWGWIKKAFNLVVSLAVAALAVVGAVATGGAATVVAVFAVLQAVGAIIDMVDYGRQQAGYPPMNWPTSVGEALSKGLKAMGAGDWADYVGMATDLAIALASFSVGGAAKSLGGGMQALVAVTRTTEVVGGAASGGASFALGSSAGKTGELQDSADQLEADKELISAGSKRRDTRAKELNDFLESLGEETNEFYRKMSTMIESELETNSVIANSVRTGSRQTV